MEVLKYAIIPMTWGISSLCVIFGLVVFLFKKLCKKDTHKTVKNLIRSIICAILSFAIICTYDRSNENVEPVTEETVEVIGVETESSQVLETADNPGDSKNNPIIITADELAIEIEDNITNAKERYNGKWVRITGAISDTSDGGIVYGYYLYGKKSTSGYSGIQIMCWCEDGPYSGSVLGDTQTFIGQVLEITTVNVTEIVDCERIIE